MRRGFACKKRCQFLMVCTEFKSTFPHKVEGTHKTINVPLLTQCEMHHKNVLIRSRLIVNLIVKVSGHILHTLNFVSKWVNIMR